MRWKEIILWRHLAEELAWSQHLLHVSSSYLLTVTDMPSKSLYPHFVNGCCGLTELTRCPESHRGSGAELGFALEPFFLWDLTQRRARVSLCATSSRQMVAGGKVVLSSRVMNMSLLLGLVWVLLFHKCNERKHISVPIKLLGLKGIIFWREKKKTLYCSHLIWNVRSSGQSQLHWPSPLQTQWLLLTGNIF